MSAQLRHYYRKRDKLIEMLGGSCISCGSTEKLQFDHINRSDKSFSISKWYGLSMELLRPELDKCQLLCEACHLVKTKEVDGLKSEHGKYSMYRHHGCRCDLCKKANRDQVKAWRSKQKAIAP